MEDVIVFDRNLRHGMGDLMIAIFDGHGGKAVSTWLGQNFRTIMESQYISKKVTLLVFVIFFSHNDPPGQQGHPKVLDRIICRGPPSHNCGALGHRLWLNCSGTATKLFFLLNKE